MRTDSKTLAMACMTALMACGSDPAAEELPANTGAAVTRYGEVVHASYAASVAGARALQSALEAFVADPTEATLGAARESWVAARRPYLQTEVYRFYDGPIDGADGDPEGLINAWPMDEQTVDYVEGVADAGRVNDVTFEITAENLMAANGAGGESDVAAGWHPIEFLLWGQDLSEPSQRLPGQRPASDYVDAANADRRKVYLTTLGDLLVQHLEQLEAEWAPGAANYRATFEAADPADSLQKILTGMIVLSGFETAGERLQAALSSGEQEEEHSCFSDNTHADMLYDVVGVQNVWHGSFGGTDGTGIDEVVRALDGALADELDARIQTSVDRAMALQPPFDLEIEPGNLEGNARVEALIDSLRDQERLLSDVFLELGFTVPAPE